MVCPNEGNPIRPISIKKNLSESALDIFVKHRTLTVTFASSVSPASHSHRSSYGVSAPVSSNDSNTPVVAPPTASSAPVTRSLRQREECESSTTGQKKKKTRIEARSPSQVDVSMDLDT
ncbi:hypothetical protein CDL15_Pgr000912 [Punica granatum]|uniref:Uncharacterized protein n=1 Tax=Punica granatum TaxID=22663 RepID=A0A218XJH0_PUNGR|nr:hypothetical protein CDL15_Pgr000912 [Punica granatum]